MSVEASYSQGMRAFVHQTAGREIPMICSQADYGGIAGLSRESQMDWVQDSHAYWQHPQFPHKPWDGQDYYIANTPMVRDAEMGTLPRLAMYRMAGMPFTVSEYDHPAPSEWSAEEIPIIFSYAAWQDWDGVFLFNSYSAPAGYVADSFDVSDNPAKMAFMPAAARIFLRGEVAPSPDR